MADIYELYADVVKYAQRLEDLLITNTSIDEEFIKATRKRYITPDTNVAKEWLEQAELENPFEKLRKDIQSILIKKCEEIKSVDSASISHPILEEEIHDAEYILIFIDSEQKYSHKMSALEAIVKQTTSNSIYDTVNAFLNKYREVK
jgi:hypothetical protein